MSSIHALGWALVHSLWQDALAAAGLTSLLAIVPPRAARVRYALATATLVVMLALPLTTALQLRGAPEKETRAWAAPATLRAEPPQPSPAAPPLAARIRSSIEPTLPWIVALWFSGVLVVSLQLASGWRATRRLITTATQPVPDACRHALARLAAELRVSGPVRLLASALVQVPAVVGWWRPVILVPVSALMGGALTPLQLDALLAHELAHVRRHDYLVNVLQTVIETLLFYHPAVWWVSARVRQEREHCCDDLAVAACGDARSYATALLTMEQLRAAPVLALAASGGSLVGRIRRLLLPATAETFPRWLAGVVAVGLLLLVVVGGGWAVSRGGGGWARQALPESPDSLIALATGSRDPDVRHEAVKELGHTRDPRARATLIALAQNDPDNDVRDEAVESLGKFPDGDAVRVLAAIARHDPDEDVERQAVETLGEMKNGVGLPVVVDIARTHPNPDVRRKAVESIRDEAPQATAVPVLREIASRDADPKVHRKAVRALRKLRER